MSKHSTPRTPHKKEENRADFDEQKLLENIKCDHHPNFKIDAISTNEKRQHLKLHCIKCIIDCKDFQQNEGDRMITIKELIQKSTEPQISNIDKIAKRREALQNTFLEFLTKNYSASYEQHAEEQFKAVDTEISDLIDKLTKLRTRYKTYYATKFTEITTRVQEIKARIARFLEEDPVLDATPMFSPSEVYDSLSKINNKSDLLTLLTEIHKKVRDPIEYNNSDELKTIDLIEDVKSKFENGKDLCVDMSKLKDLNKVTTAFLEKELHIYNRVHENGYQSHTMISNSNHFNLDHSRHLSDERSVYSEEASPPSHRFNYSQQQNNRFLKPENNENVNFRSIENIQAIDAEKKKMKRFRYADIGSTSLRGITKKIESNSAADSETKEKAVNQLNDWINRRVTGYLIFQNTMNHNPVEVTDKGNYKELGIHMNNVTGQKWKNLNEEDREEYRNLAKEYRKLLRKEIEAYENYDDITDLIEQFDHKIKKIRKE